MIDKRLVWVETCPVCNGKACPYCGGPEKRNHTRCIDCERCDNTGELRTELTDAERQAFARGAGRADDGEALGVTLKEGGAA